MLDAPLVSAIEHRTGIGPQLFHFRLEIAAQINAHLLSAFLGMKSDIPGILHE